MKILVLLVWGAAAAYSSQSIGIPEIRLSWRGVNWFGQRRRLGVLACVGLTIGFCALG
jgi:hypothetical protein